jgi:hypothetical protein
MELIFGTPAKKSKFNPISSKGGFQSFLEFEANRRDLLKFPVAESMRDIHIFNSLCIAIVYTIFVQRKFEREKNILFPAFCLLIREEYTSRN